jgi:predicted DNA-binding WGR domain protein
VPRFPSWVGIRLDAVAKSSGPLAETSTAKPPATQTTIVVSSGPTTKPRYFEFVEGTSRKFWEVSQSGNSTTTRWARIGSNGQTKTKSYPDHQAASIGMAKLIEEKTNEGYIERPR